eukprot:TRINITY_DN60179_c0_g1_i2.p1 TRINITY_DN60179_c0_g1~~TRINITY_DN60179_c0_g1_i2.p1  ORF type:complete len:283 (+),score=62.50 TRINITY_DN60179_c0_g1_i2:31-849(+)
MAVSTRRRGGGHAKRHTPGAAYRLLSLAACGLLCFIGGTKVTTHLRCWVSGLQHQRFRHATARQLEYSRLRSTAAKAAEDAGSVWEKFKERLDDAGTDLRWEVALEEAAAKTGSDIVVCEATDPSHIAGAADMLAARDRAVNGEREGGLSQFDAMLGLGYQRLLSTVSLRTPLTAVAVAGDGKVVGMAEVKKDGYIRNLVVDPEYRRKGIGTRLLTWCAAKARERSAKWTWMHVDIGNDAAVDFYKRLNFTQGDQEEYGSQKDMGWKMFRRM